MQKIAAVLSVVFLLAMSYAVVLEAADVQQAPSSEPDVQMVSSPSEVNLIGFIGEQRAIFDARERELKTEF